MAVFAGNGSAGSPSFTFSSDTDTGLFRSDTNELSLTTAGVSCLRATSNGRVQVGLDSAAAPTSLFEINTGSDALANVFNGALLRLRQSYPAGGTALDYKRAGIELGTGNTHGRITAGGNFASNTAGILKLGTQDAGGTLRDYVTLGSDGAFSVTDATETAFGAIIPSSTKIQIGTTTAHPCELLYNNVKQAELENTGIKLNSARTIYNIRDFQTATGSTTFTLGGGVFASWEISVYAYRNNAGNYGSRHALYIVHTLGGYPNTQWAPVSTTLVDQERTQTGSGPTIAISTAVNSSITITISGSGTLGYAYTARQLVNGPAY